MSYSQEMRCRQNSRLKGLVCVPRGSDEAMICHKRKKRAQAGGRKKELPPALKAWNREVMRYKNAHGVTLKEAMKAVKARNDNLKEMIRS